MSTPEFNPYNFVPLPNAKPIRFSLQRNLQNTGRLLSGVLQCELKFRTQGVTRQGSNTQDILFPRNQFNEPFLAGTSLKGMVRAVYEVISDSCVCHALNKDLNIPPEHKPCNSINAICSACSVFGMVGQESGRASDSPLALANNMQAKISMSDAIGTHDLLESVNIPLPFLGPPHPKHHAIYRRNGLVSGRKFYYHHDPKISQWSQGNTATRGTLREYASVNSTWPFIVKVKDLQSDELLLLVSSLVLKENLLHKFGMGKPLGLGSCSISITSSEISTNADRYNGVKNFEFSSLDLDSVTYPSELTHVLSWTAHSKNSDTGYPPEKLLYQASTTIDDQGRFVNLNVGGNSVNLGKPYGTRAAQRAENLPTTSETAVKSNPVQAQNEELTRQLKSNTVATENAPTTGQQGRVMQLMWNDAEFAVFVDAVGHKEQRPVSAFQGKKIYFIVGNWYRLSGEKAFFYLPSSSH